VRERLAQRVYPHLEPGEQIQVVVFGMGRARRWVTLVMLGVYVSITLAVGGSSPVFPLAILVAYAVGMLAFGDRVYRVVAATDRNIVVLAARPVPVISPTRVLRRLPRTTQLQGPGMLTVKVDVGERVAVPFRFSRDLAYANANVAPPFPPPGSPGEWRPPPPSYAPYAAAPTNRRDGARRPGVGGVSGR
jgi:hypothetical protein